jgi:hypothetical protein
MIHWIISFACGEPLFTPAEMRAFSYTTSVNIK